MNGNQIHKLLKTNKLEAKFVINKDPSFYEIWHEGYVEYSGQKYYFWLIDPKSEDEKHQQYEMEIRWFFKNVPREVRFLYPKIIEAFKNDATTKSNN